MSLPATQQTVWESVRSYLSFVTPIVNVLFVVILYYYTRDTSQTADALKQFNTDISEVKALLIKQGSDMGYVREWQNKSDDMHNEFQKELSYAKDKLNELEKNQIRLELRQGDRK